MSLGRSLDSSLPSGEEIRFKQKHKKLMERMAKKTHFSYDEIERLAIVYFKLQLTTGYGKHDPIHRSVIKYMLHYALDMTEYELTPYVVSYFRDYGSQFITLGNWLRMMSVLLRGTLDEQITMAYAVYKSTGVSEKLIKNTLLILLKHSFIKDNNEDDDEAVKDFTDMILKRFDQDRDGMLSFEDFRTTVREQNGFLEVFGQVVPSRLASYSFKNTFVEHVEKK